jgi:hypothetical protein
MRAFRSNREHDALYGVGPELIAEWLQCHITTARRYKRGEEPSYAALRVIELRNTGNLGLVDPHWDNWRIKGDKLISPDQQVFTRGNILSVPFLKQQVAHLQADARLPRQADWIAGEYVVAREIVNE